MIRLLCWEGYDSPRVLEPFECRRSTRVRARTLISDAGACADLLAGRGAGCDVLNINNAYVRGVLHPAGFVRALPPERFEPFFDGNYRLDLMAGRRDNAATRSISPMESGG